MPGRTGSGIAVRRPACRRVGEPILFGVPGTGAPGKIGGTTRP